MESLIEFVEEIKDVKKNGFRIRHIFNIPISFIMALPSIILLIIIYVGSRIGNIRIK